MITTIVVFFVILVVLVLIHEFGHFMAAKWMGVRVDEFGFGFPPRAFGKKIGETLYSFNWLPLGGFVKVFGEEYHEDEGKISAKDKKRAFVYKKPWQKLIILVAGVVMNFLLGWFLITIIFTQGVPVPSDLLVVQQVTPGSPAEDAGLQKGDAIIEIIDEETVYTIEKPEDLIKATEETAGNMVTIVYQRDTVQAETQVTPRLNPPEGEGSLGVSISNFKEQKYSWIEAPFYGLQHAFTVTITIIRELGKIVFTLLTFQKPQVDVTGPVGIAQYTGQAIEYGWRAVLELTALLSLNLAVVNLLPFPALDGGRIVFVMYEWVTRRRINQVFERNMNLIGIISLLALSAVVTVFDIMRIFR